MENNIPTIDEMILSGAVEVAAIDQETGEFLYQFTPKLKDILPDVWKAHINSVHNDIMYFWEKGFVHIENMTSESPIVGLTELAFDETAIAGLPEGAQWALKEIKRILKVV